MPYPFHGEEFEFTQSDGRKIKLKGWGDQSRALFETLDGYTVIKNPLTGFHEYAKLSDDGTSLAPSGLRVGLEDPKVQGLPKHLRSSKETHMERSSLAFSRLGSKSRWQERREEARAAKSMAMMSRGVFRAPPPQFTKGDYVGLCLLIQFPDVQGTIQKSEVENFCNKQGYNAFENKGSVYDYFYDVSTGKLKYTNIVTPYYIAKKPKDYYTDPNVECPIRARELIVEALTDLKQKGFDFIGLSTDDKGYIFALNVFYAGPRTNEWAEGLWPHSWYLETPFDIGNGKKFNDYQITDMSNQLKLATFCHENGHMVCDFPDLYDYGLDDPGQKPQSNGVGLFCLMCWGGPDNGNPTQIGAYLKYRAGWADKVTNLILEGVNTVKAGINDFYVWPKSQTEYFIIENRIKENRDISLPSSGLAIWHVEELGSNDYEEMLPGKHYECSLEQADNRFDLEHMANDGDPQDLFSAGVNPNFGYSTAPNSRWWDGSLSGLEISEIGNPGNEMKFKLAGKGNKFCKTSSPNKIIPDNSQLGITDVIAFEDVITVSSIKVGVDIDHTYRGDLRLVLTSPSGTSAVLHDRVGASSDNLKTTFDIASAPELQNLLSQTLRGNWTLQVQDLAARDEGVLRSWSIEAEGQKNNVIELQESPSAKIPDKVPAGITRIMVSDANGNVNEVEVSLDITHTYIGDLMISLISPKGTIVDLHKREGAGLDNIIKTYTAITTPGLKKLAGEPIKGQWKLKAADLAGRDEGKLNRWALRIVPS